MTDTSKSNPAIALSRSIDDVIVAAAADPTIKAAFIAQFGGQIAEAQKSPFGMMAGAVIGAVLARVGVSADPAVIAVAGGVAAILGGDLWQWASAKWFPTVKPAPLSIPGTSGGGSFPNVPGQLAG